MKSKSGHWIPIDFKYNELANSRYSSRPHSHALRTEPSQGQSHHMLHHAAASKDLLLPLAPHESLVRNAGQVVSRVASSHLVCSRLVMPR